MCLYLDNELRQLEYRLGVEAARCSEIEEFLANGINKAVPVEVGRECDGSLSRLSGCAHTPTTGLLPTLCNLPVHTHGDEGSAPTEANTSFFLRPAAPGGGDAWF